MPIVTTVTAPPPVVVPPPVPPPVALPDIGFASATFYAPDGTAWPLTDPPRGWFTLADGVTGLGAAPVEFTTDAHPRGGSRLRHVQPQDRTIVWPIHVYGTTHNEFVARWRALARAFTSTLRQGPGILEIARPDGRRRQILCYYREGFEGDNADATSDSAILSLYCEDPYWTDPVAVTVHREHGVGEDYLVPFPSVSSSQVLGETTVDNPGDVTVWPTWVITGPASLVTFTHADSGDQFVLDPNAAAIAHGNLLTGEQVTVTTDPARVRYQDGSNWVATLNWPGAVLWGLEPGGNPVTFQLDGSGPGSAVDLSFLPRYETA